MDASRICEILERHPQLKKDLFIRGFLITDQKPQNLSDFPFYNHWRMEQWGEFYFLAHEKAGMHLFSDDRGNLFFLMGHAYNPFTMETKESEILRTIAQSYGTEQYLERVSDLTGVFVFGDVVQGQLHFLVDPSGMQSACCGLIDGRFYLSSHPQLIGDLCNLEMDEFVQELICYKWYGRVMGPYLPADLTPFSQLKRVVPSIFYCYDGVISHKRYWPLEEVQVASKPEDYERAIRQAADILRRNMELVASKWEHPWISLTGGIDSNTTFAASNGSRRHFESFSYISAEKEIPDAAAAKEIANHFGMSHHEYHIPERNEELSLFEERRELFRHNNGYIAELYDNEVRKKLFLHDEVTCDVEVKSWVSETIRGYWYKHYGRATMPKLSAKLFRNLYKIFITNRSLAHKIDRLFAAFIQEYEYEKIPACYPPADMHYNEVTWGSWGGLNITEMKYCFDITFIYNNRRFFDLMFQVPLQDRISDQHHLDMKKTLDPELFSMGIRVVNLRETKFRAFVLNLIFTWNSILPF